MPTSLFFEAYWPNGGVESVKQHSFFEFLLWRFIQLKVDGLLWVGLATSTLGQN